LRFGLIPAAYLANPRIDFFPAAGEPADRATPLSERIVDYPRAPGGDFRLGGGFFQLWHA